MTNVFVILAVTANALIFILNSHLWSINKIYVGHVQKWKIEAKQPVQNWNVRANEQFEKNRKSKTNIKKINREIIKKSPNLRQVLQWQDKASKLLCQGLKMMEKRSVLKQPDSDQPKTVRFELKKVSEKFDNDHFKVKDILYEIDDLFTKSIEKVCSRIYCNLNR